MCLDTFQFFASKKMTGASAVTTIREQSTYSLSFFRFGLAPVWAERTLFFARVGLCHDGFVAHNVCLLMLPGGYLAAQNFAGVRLGAAEDGFVNFAIRILRQHRAERAVGSHGTATVADREVAAGETVFVFD